MIVPWKQDLTPYSNGLRANVYNAFKKESEPGDWWCFKLDADEFYAEDPRTFLVNVPSKYQLVAKKSLDYFITKEDIEEYPFTGNFSLDKTHISYIGGGCWTEPRFFRYREGLVWTNEATSHYPKHAGVLCPQTILVRHYQYRSPEQMQKRLDLRNAIPSKKAGQSFRHVKETDWHQLLKNRKDLVLDDGKLETYRSLPIRNSITLPAWKNALIELGVKSGLYR